MEILALTEFSLCFESLKVVKVKQWSILLFIILVLNKHYMLKMISGYYISMVQVMQNTTKLCEIQTNYSNNEAEYETLTLGLETLIKLCAKNDLIRRDSQLVIKK